MTKASSVYRSSTLAFPEYLGSEADGFGYDAASHTWRLGDVSTTPKVLRTYAEAHGHQMPKGLYTFFGKTSKYHIEREIDHVGEGSPGGTGYDIRLNIELPRRGGGNASRTLIWKHPEDIKALYLGVGRTTKSTNDALRFFFGERHCLDRLTAEPWRVDEYILVLEMLHGPLKAIIFNAMTHGGAIAPIMRILDPSCVHNIEALGVYTSLTDPNPPQFELPKPKWPGWIPSASMAESDQKALREFISLPVEDLESRQQMIKRRSERLKKSGAIKENPVMDLVIERRLESA